MAESEFDAPVLAALGRDTTARVVSNSAEAIACLSSIYWPKAGKQCWREAAHVCMQAWRGYRTEEDARLAFIAAAQAAGVLIGGHRHPAGIAWRRTPHRAENLQNNSVDLNPAFSAWVCWCSNVLVHTIPAIKIGLVTGSLDQSHVHRPLSATSPICPLAY